jgi:hypothetical protein
MRAFTIGLLKRRVTRWSMFAAVLPAAALSLAWLSQPCYRLGGGFLGSGGDMIWTCFQVRRTFSVSLTRMLTETESRIRP